MVCVREITSRPVLRVDIEDLSTQRTPEVLQMQAERAINKIDGAIVQNRAPG